MIDDVIYDLFNANDDLKLLLDVLINKIICKINKNGVENLDSQVFGSLIYYYMS